MGVIYSRHGIVTKKVLDYLDNFSIKWGGCEISKELILTDFQQTNAIIYSNGISNTHTYEVGIAFKISEMQRNDIAICGDINYGSGIVINVSILNDGTYVYPIVPSLLNELKLKLPNSYLNKWIFVKFKLDHSNYEFEYTVDFKTFEKSSVVSTKTYTGNSLVLGRVGSADTFALHGTIDLKNTYIKQDNQMYGSFIGKFNS